MWHRIQHIQTAGAGGRNWNSAKASDRPMKQLITSEVAPFQPPNKVVSRSNIFIHCLHYISCILGIQNLFLDKNILKLPKLFFTIIVFRGIFPNEHVAAKDENWRQQRKTWLCTCVACIYVSLLTCDSSSPGSYSQSSTSYNQIFWKQFLQSHLMMSAQTVSLDRSGLVLWKLAEIVPKVCRQVSICLTLLPTFHIWMIWAWLNSLYLG